MTYFSQNEWIGVTIMEKRNFDKLGIETSLLGFGCMRFPTTKTGEIDEVEAEKMLDYAISHGVNYIDTAYPYHQKMSEPFVGKVLNKYPRDSYYLATKLPCWDLDSIDYAKEMFENQRKRLDKDFFDFYLLHALNKDTWKKVRDLGIVEYLHSLKEEGKIRFLGFSFHDDYEVFEEIISYYPWDFCQIQLNYMDTEEQAGLKGYELTERLGIPLIIMEPVKGGSLAVLPDDISTIFKNIRPEKSISSWALRYVGSLPNVKVILSGMSTMEQVKDNLSTFETFEPLSQKEQEAVLEVTAAIKSRLQNGCTACKYCMPCPAGVNIPQNFSIWNHYHMYGNEELTKNKIETSLPAEARADLCVQCGKCETVCPQKLSIREDLKRVTNDLKQFF